MSPSLPAGVERISSRANPKIKQLRALKQRKARQESGLFLVEGLFHIGAALEAGARFESAFYVPELLRDGFATRLIADLNAHNIPLHAVERETFESVAEKDNPQGILAVLHWQPVPLEQAHIERLGVALVRPQDPGNLGTILRTMDAVGAGPLFLLEESVEPGHPSAVRASMGSVFWLPVIETSFSAFDAWRRTQGAQLIGTSARGDHLPGQFTLPKTPSILLLGSEREGLSPEQLAACDASLRLPMRGRITSLNLAVAAGVLLYQLLG